MAGKESRQCPHFNITDGVCGCPEFWRPAQDPQHDRSSSAFQETLNARYSQSASNRQVSLSVNSIPLPDRKKAQQVTPAPPVPPKETCFFWYHGSCRRGDECDRPHEAHPTWPIPPPPGFRHYQPCTLPLCPLRSDLADGDKPQEYQRRRHTIGGQMDGVAFSRATTTGEGSSDSDTNINTDTDMSEIGEDTYMTSDDEILSLSAGARSAAVCCADDRNAEGTTQAGEVKAQEMGRNDFDESDYVDLSQPLPPSPPSTPHVQRETLMSISHPGTLSKRRHSPAANSPRSNKRRVKLEEISTAELDDVISLFEHPRKMSRWDVKPRSFGLDGQHSEPAAPYLAALHSLPVRPSTEPQADNNSVRRYVPPPFGPPRGPRSMSMLPPICLFFYHKGYCKPKNGRRCDYLHDMHTPQKKVSLRHGIDNHDPACSLPECPVRLRRAGQVQQDEGSLAPHSQPEIEHEPQASARVGPSQSFGIAGPPQHGLNIFVRSRPSGHMVGGPLPQLTGPAKEQKTHIDHLQGIGDMSAAKAASAVEAIVQRQTEKKKKRKKRGKKKSALASSAEILRPLSQGQDAFQQDVDKQPGTLSIQQPLPSVQQLLSLPLENTTVLSEMLPVGSDRRWGPRQRNDNELRDQDTKSFSPRESLDDRSVPKVTQNVVPRTDTSQPLPGLLSIPEALDQPVCDKGSQVSKGRAMSMEGRTDQGPRARYLSKTQHQRVSSYEIVPFEYPQEALGLSSEERRARMFAERRRREMWIQGERIAQKDATVTRDERANNHDNLQARSTLTANVGLADPRCEHNAGYDGSFDRPRCQRCGDMDKGCDRISGAGPCLRCKDAGIGAEGCVDWRLGGSSMAHGPKRLVDYELPEGDQRLDWDTDLVRTLFGEIE